MSAATAFLVAMWRFGDVLESRHAIAPGARASAPSPRHDDHARVAADPGCDRTREAEIALFLPLFTTVFLL